LEQLGRYALDTDTIVEKIKETLEQIDEGLNLSIAGSTATMLYNQAIGSGAEIPSGQAIAPLLMQLQGLGMDFQTIYEQYKQAEAQYQSQLQAMAGQAGQAGQALIPPPPFSDILSRGLSQANVDDSLYGQLVSRLYAVANVANSPLANDPDFIAVLTTIGELCENSPSKFSLDNVDIIEQLERKLVQKQITKLIKGGAPTTAKITSIINDLDPADYISAVAEYNIAGVGGAFTLPFGSNFTKAYQSLLNAVKSIKNKSETLKGLSELKDKLDRLLQGVGGLQAKLATAQTGLLQAQQLAQQQAQQALLQQQQAQLQAQQAQQQAQQLQRRQDVADQKQIMRTSLRSDTNLIARLSSTAQHPVLPNPQAPLGYYNFLPWSPSLSGTDYSAQPQLRADVLDPQGIGLRKDIIVEVRGFKKSGAPTRYSTQIPFDGNGDALINPDTNSRFNSFPEVDAWLVQKGRPPLRAYLFKNYLNAKKQLYLGDLQTFTSTSAVAPNILRYTNAEMKGMIDNEIQSLDRLLDNDPNYDPRNNPAQQLVPTQGFGFKKGEGYTIYDLGSDIKKFFGGNLGGRPNVMCPAVYRPVKDVDGKTYSNSCEAYASGTKVAKDEDEIVGGGYIKRRIKIGKGIAVEEQPRYRTFGKYIIHIPFLENENVLNFKFPSMGSIPTLKPVSIDDNFKEFIIDILNTGVVNQKHYDSLTEAEKAHFNKIVKGAGLSNALKFKVDSKIDDKKDLKRIDILVGQIIAGNDNDKVLKEAKELIRKCVANGSISKNKGMDLLFQIE
jgi:hypothetical protein